MVVEQGYCPALCQHVANKPVAAYTVLSVRKILSFGKLVYLLRLLDNPCNHTEEFGIGFGGDGDGGEGGVFREETDG